MKLKDSSGVRFALVFVTLTVVVVLMAHTTHGGGLGRVSVPHDWSHRHVVFSAPSSIWQAWKLQQEPRYWHQLLRRNAEARQGANFDPAASKGDPLGQGRGHKQQDTLRTDWGMSLGIGGTAGAAKFPAKFTFDINAAPSCTNDFVIFNTSLAGSGTQATVIAFDHLYSTQGGFCLGNAANGTGPQVRWAYNTGTDPVQTSVVLSLDGTKVAFVGTVGGGATLHILKWKAGQGTAVNSPATADTTLSAGQSWTASCPAANSCIRNIAFSGAQPDTNSSPFYDYTNDILWVGDDTGNVHKFTGVFLGTPAEVTTSPWPKSTGHTNTLTSPVFDSSSSKIFVADSGGLLYSIDSTSGAVVTSGQLADSAQAGFVDAPIVDSSAAQVYVFTAYDLSKQNGVFQLSTGFSGGNTGSEAVVGTKGGKAPAFLTAGSFDNIYFTSSNAASPSGNLYVCGQLGGTATLFRVPITNNAMGTPSAMATAMTTVTAEECSPVTEIFNGSTDRIFVSVAGGANTGANISCPSSSLGCIMSFDVTAGTTPSATSATASASGGTSGIVVDNVSSSSQASSIYFTYLSNAATGATCNGSTGIGCAIKLTQSALQ